jgi:hypothetical protein
LASFIPRKRNYLLEDLEDIDPETNIAQRDLLENKGVLSTIGDVAKEDVIDPTLHLLGLAYNKGIGGLSRAGARALGLPVSDEASPDEMLANALFGTKKEYTLPLSDVLKTESRANPFGGGPIEQTEPKSIQGEPPSVSRDIGRGSAKFAGRMGLDPLTYVGLGGLEEVPIAGQAVKTGFTGMALGNAYGHGKKAIEERDPEEAVQALGDLTLGTLGGVGLAKDYLPEAKPEGVQVSGSRLPPSKTEIESALKAEKTKSAQTPDVTDLEFQQPIKFENTEDQDAYRNLSPESLETARAISKYFDVTAEDAAKYATGEETGAKLEGFTADPRARAKNIRGKIYLNLRNIAKESASPEEFVQSIADKIAHEKTHGTEAEKPHGYAVAERKARGASSEFAEDLGQGPPKRERYPAKDYGYNLEGAYVDSEGNLLPEETAADFSFETPHEATKSALYRGTETPHEYSTGFAGRDREALIKLYRELRSTTPLRDMVRERGMWDLEETRPSRDELEARANEIETVKNKIFGKKTLTPEEQANLGERWKSILERQKGKTPEEDLSRMEVKYQGEPVQIIKRSGNVVRIRKASGEETTVQHRDLSFGESIPTSAQAKRTLGEEGGYHDLTSEIEKLLGEGKTNENEPPIQVEPLPEKPARIDKQTGEIISESPTDEALTPDQILNPDQAHAQERQRQSEFRDTVKIADAVGKGQAGEEIRDQPTRDRIALQDKILRAMEAEEIKNGRDEKAAELRSEREKLKLQNQILKGQQGEELAAAKADKIKPQVRQQAEADALQRKIETEQAKEREGKSPIDDIANNFVRQSQVGPKKPESLGDYLAEAAGFFRSIKSSLDIGVPLRQARSATLAHPIEAAGMLKKSVESFFSPEKAREIELSLLNHPKFKPRIENGQVKPSLFEEAGGKFIGSGFDPSAEIHGSYYAPKIPILGKGVAAAERSSQVYVNLMRAHLFDNLTKNLGEMSPENKSNYEAAAQLANLTTGRGSLGTKGERAIPFLNNVLWSTRFSLSKYQQFGKTVQALLDPRSEMPANVRKEYLRQAGALVGTGVALLGASQMLGAEADLDPNSPRFLKARFGKLTWAPFGSATPDVVRLIQTYIGRRSGKGKLVTGPKNYTNLWFNPDTGSGRIAPPWADIYKMGAPGKYAQMETSGLSDLADLPEVPSKALGMLEPMSVTDPLKELSELGPIGSLATYLPGLLGESFQYEGEPRFSEEPKKKKGFRASVR